MAGTPEDCPYVTRGGLKLKHALDELELDVKDMMVADYGCHQGGFTDCLLQEGADPVFAVDTGYGILEWILRIDARVGVLERTNAMHLKMPDPMDMVVCDVGWTKQKHILPAALRNTKDDGHILSLFKPQYEAPRDLVHDGVVADEDFDDVLRDTLEELKELGLEVDHVIDLPQRRESTNREAFLHLRPRHCDLVPEAEPELDNNPYE